MQRTFCDFCGEVIKDREEHYYIKAGKYSTHEEYDCHEDCYKGILQMLKDIRIFREHKNKPLNKKKKGAKITPSTFGVKPFTRL